MSQTAEVAGQSSDPIASGVVKAVTIWTGVGFSKLGINTWSDVAAVLAVVYTTILILDFFWKRIKEFRVQS